MSAKVIRFPKRDPSDPIWGRNYTDIRDAFGVAVLRFLEWERSTMDVRFGQEPSMRVFGLDQDYPEIPHVKFNGVEMPISKVFEMGLVVHEMMPAMLSHAMAMTSFEREDADELRLPPSATYAQMAAALIDDVGFLFEEMQEPPLPYRPRPPISFRPDGGSHER
jgi:hypothetical protein